ncbi:MAG: acyl-CoA ligase (AMP-forming), exosortase A system-associated [Gammaproteobacteria bacterium]
MTDLLHDLLEHAAERRPERDALVYEDRALCYGDLDALVTKVASGLVGLGLGRQERVAVYLAKRFEAVAAMFGAARAGLAFVPINPLLKPDQVAHILKDCGVRVLITAHARVAMLVRALNACPDLDVVVLVDDAQGDLPELLTAQALTWEGMLLDSGEHAVHRVVDMDMAALLYTSGSTGRPKGVVLSHRNMVAGARSVAEYLENRPSDRLLAALPFSFDYGFSQLSTAFERGACVVLIDYLFPQDIINAVERERITGLAGVPPLWIQLAQLEWPVTARDSLRYITNSGGAMPMTTVRRLRQRLPNTRVFLMYGLTEAFRSTYLPPEQVEIRPGSMGKAIPNAEIMVVREDGTPCAPGEPGELVHRGALVAMGYWNDPEKTAARFRPCPGRPRELVLPELAVWSGDTVMQDEEGYLYFVARRDEMIKTSGYRVSPTEVEEVLYDTGLAKEACAVGVPHPVLGQAIAVVAVAADEGTEPSKALFEACKARLPTYMLPSHIEWRSALPRNPNGKIDRSLLARELQPRLAEQTA